MIHVKGKYTGSLPLNARVTVDYSSGDVKFSYPNKVSRTDAMRKAAWVLYGIFLLCYMFLAFACIKSWAVVGLILDPPAIPNVTIAATMDMLIRGAALLSLVFLPPMAATMSVVGNEDRFRTWFPKINAKFSQMLGTQMYKIVFRKTKDKRVEIPMFSNMVMDYKAVGEFAKNLQKVEIKEHEFSMKLRKKQSRNEYLWKAIFTFKEDCNRGYLKVHFI